MFNFLMNNYDVVMFIFSLVVGFIFVWHGWPKFRKPDAMAQGMGWPRGVVVLLGALEVLAGLAIILGILVQWAGLLMVLIMIGAIYYKIMKWKTPFWSMSSTGWEFDLLLLICALLITAHGPLGYSILG
jgi:uncharacterized membrane protein YphA (DoxX/SURF4 family)